MGIALPQGVLRTLRESPARSACQISTKPGDPCTKLIRTRSCQFANGLQAPPIKAVSSVRGRPIVRMHVQSVSAPPAATAAPQAAPAILPVPPAAPATVPPDPTKAKPSPGWRPLRSEMIQAAVPAPLGTVTLAPFDVTFGQFMGTVLKAFFWPVAPPDAHALLLQSLRHTLSAYPTFCGRALDGGKIDINNAGVLVHLGTCAATLADVLPSGPDKQMHDVVDLSEFSTEATASLLHFIASQQPLVECSIGTLADGGLVVMVNFQHVLGDTHTVRQFVYDWASTTRALPAGQTPPALEPYEFGRGWFDRLAARGVAPAAPVDVSDAPAGSPWVHVPFHARPAGPLPPCSPVVLYIGSTRLQQLKATANQQAKRLDGGASVAFVSTNDALMARLRQVLARLPCCGASHPTATALAVELRKRLRSQAGHQETSVGDETALGNILLAAHVDVRHDPTEADLGAMAAAVRNVIERAQDSATAEAAWAAQVEREHGIDVFLEYVFGKLDLFGPFPDFCMTNWDYSGDKLDFGTGPAYWIQGWLTVPDAAMITPALHPDYKGGVFVSVTLTDDVMAEFKQAPYPV